MKGLFKRRFRSRYYLTAFSVLIVSQFGLAASNATLHLEEALSRTLAHNPGLVSFGYQLEAQQGRVFQSRVRPATELDIQVENILGSGIYEEADGAETTLSLGWVFERGKRQRYIEAAKAGVSVLESEAEVRRLDEVARTATLFLDNLELQERLKLSKQAVTVAEQTATAVSKRVRAGQAPTADQSRVDAALALAQLATLDLTHELATARQQLATQWGKARPDFMQVTGNWRVLPAPVKFEVLLAQIDRSPSMSLYLNQRRLSESKLQLAKAEDKPNWRVNAGVRQLELTDDHAIMAGITIPLTTKNRNRGRIAEAQANLAQVDAARDMSRLKAETKLFERYQALQHSLHRAETLAEEVLPRLQKATEQIRQGYKSGRYRYSELQQLQAKLLSTEMELVDASIDARRNQIEIERLTGVAMPTIANKSGEEQ